MKSLTAVLVLILLAGCSTPRIEYVYKDVMVPVYITPEAPRWLSTPYSPEALPVFLPPGQGIVSLDQEGVDRLKVILRTLTTRDEAWRAWSEDDGHATE